jgi:WD40 repeat protein
MQFSPDGESVLIADEQMEVYEARTGAKLRTLLVPKDELYNQWSAAQFSPDGRTIVGRRAWSRNVLFWAADTGALIGKFELRDGNRGSGMTLGFSPDSKRLAVADDRLIHVVNVASRTEDLVLRGHEEKVIVLTFSKDGSRLLTGSEDRSAILWEVATGRILAVYKGHPGPVQLVACSPDGNRVATGSSDSVARVWQVDLLPEFEKRKPRELSPQERERYELPAK